MIGLCVAGLALLAQAVQLGSGLFVFKLALAHPLVASACSGSASVAARCSLMTVDYVVRLLGRYARLHYVLLNKANPAI